MEITFTTVLALIALLALPIWAMVHYGASVAGRLTHALSKWAAATLATGAAAYYAVKWDNAAATAAMAALAALLPAAYTAARSGYGLRRSMSWVYPGLLAATAPVAVVAAGALFGFHRALEARVLLPLMGILCAATAATAHKALRMYRSGVRLHHQYGTYLLGNGATPGRAEGHYTKRAVEAAAGPVLSRLAATAAGAAPMVVWTVAMSGGGAAEAVAAELIVAAGMLCSATLFPVAAIYIMRKTEGVHTEGTASKGAKGGTDNKNTDIKD